MPQSSPAGSSLATLSEVPGTELRQLQASFESFREFVARYSPWLSDTCIFVETLEEVPVGTPVRLEIRLRDRPLLIRALGRVDWVRTAPGSDEEGPPGVALDITYLDPACAHLIDAIFRLYTGQQSAAMGKEVVETWELDVESLIDQAFPGAPEPGAAPPEKAPRSAPPPADALQDTDLPPGVVAVETRPSPEASMKLEEKVEMSELVPAELAGLPEPDEAATPVEPLDELAVPSEWGDLEAPAELAAPAASIDPDSPAASVEPSSVVPPLETTLADDADLAAEISGAGAGTAMSSAEPVTDDDVEWEARLAAAFSEHDAGAPAEVDVVPPQDLSPQEPSEASGFGFGLVEPAANAEEIEDLAPPTGGSDSFAPEAGTTQDSAARSRPEPPPAPEPPPTPAATQPLAARPRLEPPPTPAAQPLPVPPRPEPPPDPAATRPMAARPQPEPAIEPAAARPTPIPPPSTPAPEAQAATPLRDAVIASRARADAAARHPAVGQVAGAASAAAASDASFLRRSVLAFLLAVVAVGLVFVWFRGRQPVATGEATIAETAVAVPPEPVSSSSGGAASEAAPRAGAAASPDQPSGAAASGESLAAAAPSGESPAAASPVSVTPPAAPPSAGPAANPEAEPLPAPERATVETEPRAPAVAEQDPAPIVAAVEQRIKAWAAAWSQQQVEAYFECYAPDFSPPGTPRREWERQRAARIQAPASILVQAKDISVKILDTSRARATFYQDYETDTKHLYTWKTMELAQLPEGWRIVGERVGR